MKLVSCIIFIILVSFIIAYFGIKVLRKRSCIIVPIEIIIVFFLTLLGIIENYPTGNIQNQLSSYFGNITNDLYLKYIPLIILTIIFHKILKKYV